MPKGRWDGETLKSHLLATQVLSLWGQATPCYQAPQLVDPHGHKQQGSVLLFVEVADEEDVVSQGGEEQRWG